MINKTCLLCIAFILALAGCAHEPPMYYFGNSSSTLYAYKKEPSDKSYMAMKHSLEFVIEYSELNGIRVAPGVFANLGYLNLLENNSGQAVEFFKREKALYPESTRFMDRMINKVETMTGRSREGDNDAKG